MNVQIITATGRKTCKFSVAAQGGMRECHYGPPTANAVLVQDGKGGIVVNGVISVFPIMNPDARCGKYERSLVAIQGKDNLVPVLAAR